MTPSHILTAYRSGATITEDMKAETFTAEEIEGARALNPGMSQAMREALARRAARIGART